MDSLALRRQRKLTQAVTGFFNAFKCDIRFQRDRNLFLIFSIVGLAFSTSTPTRFAAGNGSCIFAAMRNRKMILFIFQKRFAGIGDHNFFEWKIRE